MLNAALTSNERRLPIGDRHGAEGGAVPRQGREPSPIRSALVTLPEGLSINPDAADGQTACTDEQANFDTEGADECPDTAKIGTFADHHPGPRRTPARCPLHRRTQAGQPVPAPDGRLGLRDPREGRRGHPQRPSTGQVTFSVDGPPPGPVRNLQSAPLRLGSGPARDADPLHLYKIGSTSPPGTTGSRRSLPNRTWNHQGPGGRPCPAVIRPFNPRLVAGMSNADGGSLLQLPPEARP